MKYKNKNKTMQCNATKIRKYTYTDYFKSEKIKVVYVSYAFNAIE